MPSDFDFEPGRRRPPPTSGWFAVARAITGLAWFVCGCGTLIVATLFWSGMRRADNAIQEASVSAMCAFMVIALYVLARSFDKIIRG